MKNEISALLLVGRIISTAETLSDPNFLGVYTPYEVPLVLDGEETSLTIQYGDDPTPQSQQWCQKHVAGSWESCTAHISERALELEQAHGEKSRDALSRQAWSTEYPVVVEHPLPGELTLGPNPTLAASWQSQCRPGPMGGRLVATFDSSAVLVNTTLGAGDARWEGMLAPLPRSNERHARSGTLRVILLGAGGSNNGECQSAPVQVSHTSNRQVVVSIERGDRGGAVVHSTLLSWALARRIGVGFGGSLRPMLAEVTQDIFLP